MRSQQLANNTINPDGQNQVPPYVFLVLVAVSLFQLFHKIGKIITTFISMSTLIIINGLFFAVKIYCCNHILVTYLIALDDTFYLYI